MLNIPGSFDWLSWHFVKMEQPTKRPPPGKPQVCVKCFAKMTKASWEPMRNCWRLLSAMFQAHIYLHKMILRLNGQESLVMRLDWTSVMY